MCTCGHWNRATGGAGGGGWAWPSRAATRPEDTQPAQKPGQEVTRRTPQGRGTPPGAHRTRIQPLYPRRRPVAQSGVSGWCPLDPSRLQPSRVCILSSSNIMQQYVLLCILHTATTLSWFAQRWQYNTNNPRCPFTIVTSILPFGFSTTNQCVT